MLLVFVTSSLWFLIAFASPCRDLPPKVGTAPSVGTFCLHHMCCMQTPTSNAQHCFLFFPFAHVLRVKTRLQSQHCCIFLIVAHASQAKTHLASQRCTLFCSSVSLDVKGSTCEKQTAEGAALTCKVDLCLEHMCIGHHQVMHLHCPWAGRGL